MKSISQVVEKKGVIQEKWGSALETGFQVVPNILIRGQKQLELDPIDVVVLLNLMSHWWEKGDRPFIAPSRIANRMNVTTRTVERHLKKLEKKGLLQRCKPQQSPTGSYTRGYDLEPLVEVLKRASKNAVLLRQAQQNQLQDLDQEEIAAPTQLPKVQNNGDAKPVHRVASPIPTGEGLGNPGPRVVSIKDNEEFPAEHEQDLHMTAMLSKIRNEDLEDRLLGKACPVCSFTFERGHKCSGYSADDGDLF